MFFFLFSIAAYLLGSIPTAVWVGRAWHGIDVREHGSKNAGATNTFRVLGKKAGIVVLSVDIIKGFLATILPFLVLQEPWGSIAVINYQLVAALSAVLGHVFPIFAGFRGGKGVATSLGVIIGLHPPAAGIAILIFLATFISTHYVSLGAIVTALVFPFLIWFVFKTQSNWLVLFSFVLAAAVIIAHRKNIHRLMKGEENKMNLFHRKT